MEISVIIPSYKPSEYVWKCLDSIANQSLRHENYEVLIVLNGCSFPWEEQIQDYISNNNLEKYFFLFQTDTAGVSNARNIALDQARGEYITFIDDDDYVSERYLEELLDNASPDTISLSYVLNFIDNTEDFYTDNCLKQYIANKDKANCPFVKGRNYFGGPCKKLIHRDIIGDRRFDATFTSGEDSIFMFLISDKFKYVSFTSERAIYYRRIRKGSASNKLSKKDDFHNTIRLLNSYIKIFFSKLGKYNFYFTATRIWGSTHIFLKKLFR